MKYFSALIVVGFILTSCAHQKPQDPVPFINNATGLDLSGIDINTRPQDDIYQFANGAWKEKTSIPDHQSSIGVLTSLRDVRDIRVVLFLDEFSRQTNKTKGSDEQILGDLFYSLTRDSLIEGRGIQPIHSLLQEIDDVKNKAQLEHAIANLITSNVRIPFAFDVRPDFNDSSQHILSFFQSGLGMPTREYYLSSDQEFARIRVEYKIYLEKILSAANFADAIERAQNAYKIERLLAAGQWPNVDRRDPVKITNTYRPENLKHLTDKLNWAIYLQALGAEKETNINISETGFFVALGNILEEQSVEAWKDYLRVRVLAAYARYLEDEFRTIYNDFYEGVVRGAKKNPTRPQRAVFVINTIMGDAVGKIYVERFFPPSSKKKMETLVANVKAAFKDRLQNNTWLSNPTKDLAIVKLDSLLTEIGYPTEWIDYSKLKIDKASPLQNVKNIYSFYFGQKLKKLGTLAKRNAWNFGPHIVNAQFLPYQNAMFYPAGFLEPPYFNALADDAVNYAGIGVIIGHEIGHAFDDQGRQFGPEGTLEDWWRDEDIKNFKKQTKALVDLFNQYSPIEGMTINGNLTLGENIGDLVGVQVAYDAYIKSLNGKPAPVIDGFTGPQRFFIGYAQSVRSKSRAEAIRQWLVSDPHSPDEFRVIGIVPHIPAFYGAFNIKEGDGMYLPPEDRVSIW